MNKATFFRNVSNLDALKSLQASGGGIVGTYRIIARVVLTKTEYDLFCQNLQCGQVFLLPFIETSKIYKGIWNCLLIENTEASSILIMLNGYQYPRFVAIPK